MSAYVLLYSAERILISYSMQVHGDEILQSVCMFSATAALSK